MQRHNRPHNLHWLIITPTVLIMTLLLAGCGGGGGGFTQPPPMVRVDAVSVQPWQVTYATTGTVEANNKVDLNSEAPGIISQLNFREGQHVRRGQTLIRLKADKFAAQISESAANIQASRGGVNVQSAQLDQLQAQITAAEARQRIAQDEYQRFQQLYQKDFVSALELNQKKTQLDTTTADLVAARQQLAAGEAQRQQAVANLSAAQSSYRYSRAVAGETVVSAPFSGTVGEKYVDLGDFVAPTEKLLTLVDNSVMKVAFPVPERYIGYLKTGLPVQLEFEGIERPYAATVNFIDAVVNEDSRSVMVKAVIQGGGERLRHGQFGTVRLVLGTIDDAVIVPEEALINQGEKRLVYVVKDSRAHLREILVGHRDAGRVQVKSGLSAGERIITTGLQKVTDGAEINEIKPEKAPSKQKTPGQ